VQISNFRALAEGAEKACLKAFDAVAGQEGSCGTERAALVQTIHKDVWVIFQVQRLIAEQIASDRLGRALLAGMKTRKGPLRVQEKLDILRGEVKSYKEAVSRLLPSWAAGDPEEAAVERRLGELQFSIEESGAGLVEQRKWKESRMKEVMNTRAHGMSVSLDPALRVLLRPDGMGNLQVFSHGPVGPPNNPATVNFGVMNDGSIADVYREHPEPPMLAVQPAVKVNLNLR